MIQTYSDFQIISIAPRDDIEVPSSDATVLVNTMVNHSNFGHATPPANNDQNDRLMAVIYSIEMAIKEDKVKETISHLNRMKNGLTHYMITR